MRVRSMLAVGAGMLWSVSGSAQEPVTLKYRTSPDGASNRYIFSQTGWQEMEPSPPSTGNVFAAMLDHRVQAVEPMGRAAHQITLREMAVTYLLPGDYHVWQDASHLVDVPVELTTDPGRPTTLALSDDAMAALPALRGIGISPLVHDLPSALPPLPPRPVRPGDTWTVSHDHRIPVDGPDGTRAWHDRSWTMNFTFEGFEDRPAQFGSREVVRAAKLVARGTGAGSSETGSFSATMDERIELEAYFDPGAGRWLEITTRFESTMEGRGPSNMRMSGPMGYTNHFRFVR